MMWIGLFKYLRSMDTWNTIWTTKRDGGRTNLYVTDPIWSKMSKGVMKHELSFPFHPTLKISFIKNTFKNILCLPQTPSFYASCQRKSSIYFKSCTFMSWYFGPCRWFGLTLVPIIHIFLPSPSTLGLHCFNIKFQTISHQ